MNKIKHIFLTSLMVLVTCSMSGCNGGEEIKPNVNGRGSSQGGGDDTPEEKPVTYDVYALPDDGAGVPVSTIWAVDVVQYDKSASSPVFQSTCPRYQEGYMGLEANDKAPLDLFYGRSISWTNFSFEGEVEVRVTILDKSKFPSIKDVKILPSRKNVTASVEGNVISFKLNSPGQYSVEIGAEGYKNGLMVFANPRETLVPEEGDESYFRIDHATAESIKAIPAKYSGVYFKAGVHDIGKWTIPNTVKNVYVDGGAYVYGAFQMDGHSNVHIFGRGVLSQGRMNVRTAHGIEACNGSNRIDLEGITVADVNYFSVRLVGNNNNVEWVKVIGGWIYHCDGISAYGGSKVNNCFIMANDDNIKCYETGVSFTNIVSWQLNNGGLIQLNWGNGKCDYAEIRHVDILHAEWNAERPNRGILSCVGNKYYYERGGFYQQYVGWSKNVIIEDVVAETEVPLVIMIQPYNYSPMTIQNITLKDWRVAYSGKFKNHLEGTSVDDPITGLSFQNVQINGTTLTKDNYASILKLVEANLAEPSFR